MLAVVAVAVIAMRFSDSFGGSAAGIATTSAAKPLPSASDVTSQLRNSPTPARTTSRTRGTGKKAVLPVSLDPTLRYDLLKSSEDTKYEGTGRNIFRVFVEIPRVVQSVAKKKADQPAATAPYVPPPLPPSNLRFYGFATNRADGAKRIFLAKNEDVFIASEGDIVDRRYKVVRISANSVEILDVLSNNRENIPLTQG
jgi:hypothetical protein